MSIIIDIVSISAINNDVDKLVELATRKCWQSEFNSDINVRRKFVESKLKLGHESPLEHGSFTIEFSGVSRSWLAQETRHRTGSAYSIESQRYVGYTLDNFQYVIPPKINNNKEALDIYNKFISEALSVYNKLRELPGIPKEDARFVLPNAACTSGYMTKNFRQARHEINLRCSKGAQWEIHKFWAMILYGLWSLTSFMFDDLAIKFLPEELLKKGKYSENIQQLVGLVQNGHILRIKEVPESQNEFGFIGQLL